MVFGTQHWYLTITQQVHAQECRENVFAVSQACPHHPFLVFNKSGAVLQSVFAKPNPFSLAVPEFLWICLQSTFLVHYTCTHHNPSLFLASSIFASAAAAQLRGRKQEKDLWLLSDQSLSIFVHGDICHVQRWCFPPTSWWNKNLKAAIIWWMYLCQRNTQRHYVGCQIIFLCNLLILGIDAFLVLN